MKQIQNYRRLLLTASIIGFLFVNVPFLYIVAFKGEVYQEGMTNGLALVFMAEAFLLMFFASYLIFRMGYRKPGWLLFIVFSILGSLAFSIPFFLYLHIRKDRGEQAAGGDVVR